MLKLDKDIVARRLADIKARADAAETPEEAAKILAEASILQAITKHIK